MSVEKAGGNAGGVRIGVGLGTGVSEGMGVTEGTGVGDAVAVGVGDGSADGGFAQPATRQARIRTRLSRRVTGPDGCRVCRWRCMGKSYRGYRRGMRMELKRCLVGPATCVPQGVLASCGSPVAADVRVTPGGKARGSQCRSVRSRGSLTAARTEGLQAATRSTLGGIPAKLGVQPGSHSSVAVGVGEGPGVGEAPGVIVRVGVRVGVVTPRKVGDGVHVAWRLGMRPVKICRCCSASATASGDDPPISRM